MDRHLHQNELCKTRRGRHVRQQGKETLGEHFVGRVGWERVQQARERVQAVLHLGPVICAGAVDAVGERAMLGGQGAMGD